MRSPAGLLPAALFAGLALAGASAALPLFHQPGLVALAAAPAAALGAAGSSLVLRTRAASGHPALRRAAAALLGALLGCLGAIWVVEPHATLLGLPTPGTLRALLAARSALQRALALDHPPVDPTPPLRLALAGLSALAGASGLALAWSNPRSPELAPRSFLGLLPSAVLLGGAAALASDRDLLALVAWCLLAGGALVLGGRGAPATPGPVASVRFLVPLGLSALLGLGGALAPLAGHRLTTTAPATRGTGPLVVGQPTADLRAEKLQLARLPAFSVTARFPTYWQLTTLGTFTGTAWVPGPQLHPPAGVRFQLGRTRLVQRVDLTHLVSPWLPAAATPVGVQAGDRARVLQGQVVVDGSDPQRYTVVSEVQTAPAAILDKLAEPSPLPAWLRPALALPRIPPAVAALAHQIVRGLSSPFDRAVALVDYLTSPRFRYTLDPPPDPPGSSPLVAFLFDTRAGYCQQFASAFGVLARLDDLPTVLAVGFTSGHQVRPGHFLVSAADAHVWPEVYLGAAGWVAFEPTPPSLGVTAAGAAPQSTPTLGQPEGPTVPGGSSVPASANPTGGRTVGAHQLAKDPGALGVQGPADLPAATPSGPPPGAAHQIAGRAGGRGASGTRRLVTRPAGPGPLLPWLPVGLALAAALALAGVLANRARRPQPPERAIQLAYRRAARCLQALPADRPPPPEAQRAAAALSDLAAAASFGPRPPDPRQAARARELAGVIAQSCPRGRRQRRRAQQVARTSPSSPVP